MASLTQFAFVLLLCLAIILQEDSDSVSGYAMASASAAAAADVEMLHNRKVLSEKAAVVEGGEMEGWELRAVPSGPDPLHHNANPKKPRTP